jgi:hypothetical protein
MQWKFTSGEELWNAMKEAERAGQNTTDPHVWGTYSNHFNVKNELDVQECFRPDIGDKWELFLAPLRANGRSIVYENGMPVLDEYQRESLRTYEETLQLILSFKVPTMKTHSTLTVLQAANNIWSLGLCKPPSAEQMGGHISVSLGAYEGMRCLGMTLYSLRPHIIKAFEILSRVYDDHLHPDVKVHLGNDASCSGVEHILCKLKRYQSLQFPGEFPTFNMMVQKFQKEYIYDETACISEDSKLCVLPLALQVISTVHT